MCVQECLLLAFFFDKMLQKLLHLKYAAKIKFYEPSLKVNILVSAKLKLYALCFTLLLLHSCHSNNMQSLVLSHNHQYLICIPITWLGFNSSNTQPSYYTVDLNDVDKRADCDFSDQYFVTGWFVI